MEEKQRKLAEELLFSEKKTASFVKRLFFGEFVHELVFPYPQPDALEKQRTDQLLTKLSTFAKNEIDASWIDRHAEIPPSVIEGLKKLQIFGMTVPPEFGGLGMSQYAYCKMTETLAPFCGSTTLFVNVHQSIGLKALMLFGSAEQKAKWLPLLASGEHIAAFSLTEPNAGSDASAVETEAEYDPVKQVYRLNGVKQWSTNASVAGVLTVMARTEDDRITAFLVTPEMKGFEVTNPALEKVGFRGTKTANLRFVNMEVPAANILGEKGRGLKVALSVLDYGRTTFGAMCTGIAKYLLDRAIQHAKSRYQFQKPLAAFGLVKKKIALMASTVYAMDAATYLTAGLIDRHQEDIMLESAILKVFCSEALWSIVYETMQIFGGRSFFTDEPFERMMRDARLNTIGEGANEVMRAFIGGVGLRDVGLSLQEVAQGLRSPIRNRAVIGRFLSRSSPYFFLQTIPIQNDLLKKEAKLLSKVVREFGITIFWVLAKYREEVIEKQLDLDRLASVAIAIYSAAAVLGKLDREKEQLEAGRLYCQRSLRMAHHSLKALFHPEDQAIEALSDRLTGWRS